MVNQIQCPNCKKAISNNPLIDSAAKGEGMGSQFILCDCGERLSFWAITAQLRDQKKTSARILNWFRSFAKG